MIYKVYLKYKRTNWYLHRRHFVARRLAIHNFNWQNVVDDGGQFEDQGVPDHVLLGRVDLGLMGRVAALDLGGKLVLGSEDEVGFRRSQESGFE